MSKQQLSKSELLGQFNFQLAKIVEFCILYDNGNIHFAQDIAVKLRLLFHNTNNSKSLLRQLRLDHIPFVDRAAPYNSKNLLTHLGLVIMQLDANGGKFVHCGLDQELKVVTFENWWDGKKVIVDQAHKVFTRKKIILELAETDGGAHIDSSLKEDYYNLSRRNTTGYLINMSNTEKQLPMNDPVPASIRQIAFEVIETFSKMDIDHESKLSS